MDGEHPRSKEQQKTIHGLRQEFLDWANLGAVVFGKVLVHVEPVGGRTDGMQQGGV